MNKDPHKEIIEQALNQAFLKGVYSLEDAKHIIIALQTLNNISTQTEISK